MSRAEAFGDNINFLANVKFLFNKQRYNAHGMHADRRFQDWRHFGIRYI